MKKIVLALCLLFAPVCLLVSCGGSDDAPGNLTEGCEVTEAEWKNAFGDKTALSVLGKDPESAYKYDSVRTHIEFHDHGTIDSPYYEAIDGQDYEYEPYSTRDENYIGEGFLYKSWGDERDTKGKTIECYKYMDDENVWKGNVLTHEGAHWYTYDEFAGPDSDGGYGFEGHLDKLVDGNPFGALDYMAARENDLFEFEGLDMKSRYNEDYFDEETGNYHFFVQVTYGSGDNPNTYVLFAERQSEKDVEVTVRFDSEGRLVKMVADYSVYHIVDQEDLLDHNYTITYVQDGFDETMIPDDFPDFSNFGN